MKIADFISEQKGNVGFYHLKLTYKSAIKKYSG